MTAGLDGTPRPASRAGGPYYGEIGGTILKALADLGGQGTSQEVWQHLIRQGQGLEWSPGQVYGGLSGLAAARPPRVRLAGRRAAGRGRPGIWAVTAAGTAWLGGDRHERCGLGWPETCRAAARPAWAARR